MFRSVKCVGVIFVSALAFGGCNSTTSAPAAGGSSAIPDGTYVLASETCNGATVAFVPSTFVVSATGTGGVYSEDYGGSPDCSLASAFTIAYPSSSEIVFTGSTDGQTCTSGGSSTASCTSTSTSDSCTAGDNTTAGTFAFTVSGTALTLTKSDAENCSGGTQVSNFTLQ